MDMELKNEFIRKWKKYFGESELPILFYYADDSGEIKQAPKAKGRSCLIGDLKQIRNGEAICFDSDAIGCMGGKRYLGFSDKLRPDFEYFLSCGIPGKTEGERYKQSPELVREFLKNNKTIPAPGKWIVFKPWEQLDGHDTPEAVIFFAKPDVLSGLFTLANFDQPEPNGVICPFSAGCGSIVLYPMQENRNDNPRAVLGMFDPSARPDVGSTELSFAVPWKKFIKMISYMDGSFLITETWSVIRKRKE
jgi:hypothetical protein